MADLSGAPLRSSLIFFSKHLLNRRFILSGGLFVDRQNLFRATADKIVWFFELTAFQTSHDSICNPELFGGTTAATKTKKATKHGPCR
jgi:hypothetical protein